MPKLFFLLGNKAIEVSSSSVEGKPKRRILLSFLFIFLVVTLGFIYGQFFSLAPAQAAEISSYGSHSFSGTVQYYYKWMGHEPPQYPSYQTHYFTLGTPGTVHFQIDWSRRGGRKESIGGYSFFKREYDGWKKIAYRDLMWPWKPPNPITDSSGILQPGEYKLEVYVGFTGFFDPWTNFPVDYRLTILTFPQILYNSSIPPPIPLQEATLKEAKDYLKQTSVKLAQQALVWDSIKQTVLKGWFGVTGEQVSQVMGLRASLVALFSTFGPDYPDPNYTTVSPPTFYQVVPMEISDLELAASLSAELNFKINAISYLRAAKTALNRYQGAVAAGNTTQATYQFTAFWAYTKKATEIMRENDRWLQELSQTFQVKGVPNFSFSAENIAATQERLRTSGFLPEEIATFNQTGASFEEMEQAKQILLMVNPAQAAGKLYPLLEQERGEVKAIADSLEAIIKRDLVPPSPFDLVTPVNNSWVNKKPIFSWSPSVDNSSGNVSGLAKYELWIDGVVERDNILASQTSAIPNSSLFPGEHSWYVKAVDSAGNVTQSSTTGKFSVFESPDPILPSHTLTLFPLKDATIMDNLPYYPRTPYSNYNFGASPYLISRSEDTKDRALLKFDLSSIPSNAVITLAELKLYAPGSSRVYTKVTALRITQGWVEGTGGPNGLSPSDGVTFNTYDGVNPWFLRGADFEILKSATQTFESGYSPGWKSWDLTELVGGWLSGPNDGLILLTRSGGWGYSILFYSREYSDPDLRPRLEVTYVLAPKPTPKLISNVFAEPYEFDPYRQDTGQTIVHYTLDRESLVSIGIEDSKGRMVKEKLPRIGKAPGEPGENTVVWNGVIDFPELNKDTANSSDRSVFIAPNGTYTIKITAIDLNNLSVVDSQEIKVRVKSTF